MADIQDLEGFFNSNAALESRVEHKELNDVEELSGFEAGRVGDASLVHDAELLLGYISIEIVVDLPNDEVHIGLGRLAAEELQYTGEIKGSDLILVVVRLGGVC